MTNPAQARSAECHGSVVYARVSGVISRTIAGEHLLVPVRRGLADLQSIFSLNGVGKCIWENLDGVRPLDSVLELVCERFEVPDEQARRDLQEFVERLESAGLIERVP